jgi:hypothetical protein
MRLNGRAQKSNVDIVAFGEEKSKTNERLA